MTVPLIEVTHELILRRKEERRKYLKKEGNTFKQGNQNMNLSRKMWKLSMRNSKQTWKNSHTARDDNNFIQNWFPKSVVCKIGADRRIQMPLFYEGLERSCSEILRDSL